MKFKVLIVEDNEMLNHNISLIMSKENYEVHCALTYAMALELFNNVHPHIILLDLKLPDGSGEALIDQMRKIYHPRIIVLSALDDIESKNDAYLRGADDYLTKPFDMTELILKLEAIRTRLYAEKLVYNIGDIVFNTKTDEIRYRSKRTVLPRSQSKVLEALCDNFLRKNKGNDYLQSVEKRSLENTINRLRKNLKMIGCAELEIETEYGRGYVLVEHKK